MEKQIQIPSKAEIAAHLSGMIPFRTIAYRDQAQTQGEPFFAFHAYLEETYPLVHEKMEKQVIGTYSLLYRWKGRSSEKKPILLMAHQDVVPVPEETLNQWKYPPFEGTLAEDKVWGRGSLDCKNMLCCELEAAEALLKQGYMPERDIYFAFGHDEETGGFNGMMAIAACLKEKGVSLDFVLDEGSGYVEGEKRHCPGHTIAEIGVFEKGYADLKLTVQSPGGHASRPGPSTALGILAKAIDALEEHQFPLSIPDPVKWQYQALLPYLEEGEEKAQAGQMEKDPASFARYLSRTPKGNAMVRTTTAPTMASASVRPNVLPTQAQAVVNFRLNPDTSCESLLAHCRKAISDPRVELTLLRGEEPSKITSVKGEAYQALCRVIETVHPGCVPVPVPVLGATDSRKFEGICEAIFRFTPLDNQGLGYTVHGINEAMAVESLEEGVRFFVALIQQLC